MNTTVSQSALSPRCGHRLKPLDAAVYDGFTAGSTFVKLTPTFIDRLNVECHLMSCKDFETKSKGKNRN